MQLCSSGEEESEKEMACSFDDSKVCSSMPLKRAVCLSSLYWIMKGGEYRELNGNLKPEEGWEQLNLSLVGKLNVAGWPTSWDFIYPGKKKRAWILAWCSLILFPHFPHSSQPHSS